MHEVRTLVLAVAILVVPSVATAEPGALRVMSYNLNYANPDFAGTMDAIAAADVDVILLQEVGKAWEDALAKRFAKRYPHQVFRLHDRTPGGLAVLSKLRITSEELVPAPPKSWFPAQLVVVDSSFGKVQVLNVHLRPAIDRGSWIRGYQTTPAIRLAQIEAFWPRLAPKLPTVIVGDFNEEPSGSAVEFLGKKGLARVPTQGPTTWHYARTVGKRAISLLSMDIDHVMIDSGLTAVDAHVVDAGASDHRPVIVTLNKK